MKLIGFLLMMLLTITGAVAQPLVGYPASLDTIEVQGYQMVYHDSGTFGPPVVLVHGLGTNLSIWREVLPRLSPEVRVLAPDLPGFGLSDKHDVPATPSFYADVLAAWLDTLGLAQVDVVGLSMGGQVALMMALRHPDRIRRLVVAAPAGIETFTPEAAAQLKALFTADAIAAMPPALYAQNVQRNFARWDPERYGWLLTQREQMQQRPDFRAYAGANARAVAGMLDEPVFEYLPRVPHPALVVFGEDDQLIPNRFFRPSETPADVLQRALDRLPNAEGVLLPGAGHLLVLEQPEAFVAQVRRFLWPAD
ncbi:alpha/beta hydrolase [Rhodocaloribacter litoris]|uniref:alpha/beta fold hydrolase n=1 Tax=Rhodocaloribacter litoris TaxID=2558931 RepID=UPI00142167F7|nr:alpha/beta hydrolase [Rhodocaloribacter litoris]QXD16258.1 alpha/beta hydrolase [Rhodocaloribacter litoris]